MSKLLIFIFLLPLVSCGQSTKSQSKTDLAKIYSQAIGDFIKAANEKNKTNFDTLFFGKRRNGQPDDFPEIDLPETINNTHIKLISPEVGIIKQKERPSRTYINMGGWVENQKAEFVFFVFSNGFAHQYDYTINYNYNAKRKEFELEKLQFKGPPFDK